MNQHKSSEARESLPIDVASHTIESLPNSERKLTISLTADTVDRAFDWQANRFARVAKIPGFRPGKAPIAMVKQRYANEIIAELAEMLINEAFNKVSPLLDEKTPRYSDPALAEKVEPRLGEPFKFSLLYDVYPDVVAGKYTGLSIKVPKAAISEEDISRELRHIQERYAALIDRGTEAIEAGDQVGITWEPIDGQGRLLAGASSHSERVIAGSSEESSPFADHLVGKRKGETHIAERAKTDDSSDVRRYRFHIAQASRRVIPEMTDELVQEYDASMKTVARLRESLNARLEETLEREIRELKVNRLLRKILRDSSVELPKTMLIRQLMIEFERYLAYFNVPEERRQFDQSNNEHQSIIASIKPRVEYGLKISLLLRAIAKKENIAVDRQEITTYIENNKGDDGRTAEEILQSGKDNDIEDSVRWSMTTDRLYERLLRDNNVAISGTSDLASVARANINIRQGGEQDE